MVVISRYVLGQQERLRALLPCVLVALHKLSLVEMSTFRVASTPLDQVQRSVRCLIKAKVEVELCRSHPAAPPQAPQALCPSQLAAPPLVQPGRSRCRPVAAAAAAVVVVVAMHA